MHQTWPGKMCQQCPTHSTRQNAEPFRRLWAKMEQTLTDCFSTQNLITFRLCHNSPKLSSGYTKPHQKNVSRPHNTTQKTDCPNVAPIQSYGGKNLNWFLFRQFFIFRSLCDSTNVLGCIKSIQDNCVTTPAFNAKYRKRNSSSGTNLNRQFFFEQLTIFRFRRNLINL